MLAALLGIATTVAAFQVDTIERPGPLTAKRVAGEIVIDGRLAEAVWQGPAAITEFIQSTPDEGKPATERGEVRFAFDDEAVYVAARLFDSRPDSIMALLTRRDRESQSDMFIVYFDPYRDGRTGYEFTVSAAGVQSDGTLHNDDWSDNSWDGVWQSAVERDGQGWTVEMRIPLSQLRMHDRPDQVWGVNVGRGIGRRNEVSYLVPRLRQGSGFVSRFAELGGLDGLRPRRRLEVIPYVTGKADYAPTTAGDPFRDGSEMSPTVGGDLRLGLGGSLQLDATVNPDFGQVEVDPAVVNLSDVETFFEERRPFFVEGSNNFSFGFGGANNFMGFNWVNNEPFYTRRIGRAPQGRLPNAEYSSVPDGVPILGAAKLTGRVRGWNLGVMGALTKREHAQLADAGEQWRSEVEPLAGYGVVRLQRDVAGGRHGIGMLATHVRRDFGDEGLRSQFNSEATLLGLDGWVTLDADREWVMSGWGTLSRISGTAERIAAVQTGSTHYFQRPDASHLDLDPTRTSLTGAFGRLTLNRQRGSVLFNAAVGAVTPGYDNNDLGFIGQTDLINAHISSGYRWTRPTSWYNSARINFATFGRWDFEGNRTGGIGLWNNSNLTFKNFSSAWIGFFAQGAGTNTRGTRGGPAMARARYGELFGGWHSDGRKSLMLSVDGFVSGSAHGEGGGHGLGVEVTWRPVSNVNLSFGPEYRATSNGSQYLRTVTDPLATGTYGQRYVFGELEQRTLSANLRLNWIFSPRLSFELFAQPLISSGEYGAVKELSAPNTLDFLTYGTNGSTIDRGTGMVDPDGAGPASAFSIGQPDFTFASLRGNAVLRWEYAPGSTIFLVWTQDRSYNEALGEFRPRAAFDNLLDAPGRNVVMVKVSYWLSR